MSNFARIINNIAVDVSTDPAAQFHPDIAAQFTAVPDTVKPGWHLVDGTWTEPAQGEPVEMAVQYAAVSPVEFMLLFTSQERVAIKAARSSDPAVDDFFQLLEDPRLLSVRLGQSAVQEGLAYLVSQNLITAARRDEILTSSPA